MNYEIGGLGAKIFNTIGSCVIRCESTLPLVIIKSMNVIKKEHTVDRFLREYVHEGALILNIGSSSTRLRKFCINVDVQKKNNVDIICDAHFLAFASSSFDFCVLSAILQYCKSPFKIAEEVYKVLKPGGYIYVDAPFIQPYCSDMPDLFRYTKDGLISIFSEKFSVVSCDISIGGGSALAFYCQQLFGNSGNKYVDFAMRTIVSGLVYPLSYMRFKGNSGVAGAFYLIARKA